MSDVPETPAAEAPAVEAPAESPTEGGTEAPAVEETKTEEAPTTTSEPEETKPEGEENKEDDTFVDDEAEPAVSNRKTAKDFIIERKNAKIAKMEAAQEGDDLEAPETTEEPGEDNEPSELELLKPLVEEHIAAKNAKEVADFLEENPDFDRYKGKVERFMKHPSRQSIPASAIFYEVAGKDLMKMGADRLRAANEKASGSQAGGSGSNREALSPVDWSTATAAEMEAEQMRVRLGK